MLSHFWSSCNEFDLTERSVIIRSSVLCNVPKVCLEKHKNACHAIMRITLQDEVFLLVAFEMWLFLLFPLQGCTEVDHGRAQH